MRNARGESEIESRLEFRQDDTIPDTLRNEIARMAFKLLYCRDIISLFRYLFK